MDTSIEATELGLLLDGRAILEGVSLSVRRGEVFGVLGPNGAGKTTTVRLLNGLLKPTSGQVKVAGLDPVTHGDEVRRRTGVLTEGPALYERLSARQNLAFFAELHDIPPSEVRQKVANALAAVGLTARADDRVGTYSKGMQQRLAIARAILHEPEVLFLDEPTAGLDPESAERVTSLVDHWRARGRTVFLATHHLGDAEKQCDRFAFFAAGRVVAQGTREALAALAGARAQVAVTFEGAPPELGHWPGVVATLRDGATLRFTLEAAAAIPDVVIAAVAAGARVLSVEPQTASLQDLYFALVGRGQA